jgi:molybdenum cofactor biosynthesis enzyme MoaA
VNELPFKTADRQKFVDPFVTASGERRARVDFDGYQTLWFNTGTLCNLTCQNCYIESSPTNDRLVYLTRVEVKRFLDEAAAQPDRPSEIGLTGGEPFMNPDILGILDDSLKLGFRVLVLTNAMRPMQRLADDVLDLRTRFPDLLTIRVSLDHFESDGHEALRGQRTWTPTIDGLMWLAKSGFNVSVAGRTVWGKTDAEMRHGFAVLFNRLGLSIDAHDPTKLVLFPEMDETADVPEISEGCWRKLKVSPSQMMCANARMVVRHKGSERATVAACTLLPYDPAFDFGHTLEDARQSVSLNHRHCARFCVLGGASCSARS